MAAQRFVLDASVVVGWLLGEPEVEEARGILRLLSEREAVVPANWSLEVCNAVRKAVRTARITAAMQVQFQQALLSLPIEIDAASIDRDWTAVLPLALQSELSTCDAAYIELALREALPLATLDRQLQETAGALGIDCLR
jgi:predicted nucleic acid-binding protein